MPMADDGFRIAPAGLCLEIANARIFGHVLAGAAHHQLGQQREHDQHDGTDQRGQADIGVERETDRQVERHPGQVEKRNRAQAGQERADAVEIAQRLHALAAVAGDQRKPHDRVIDALADRLIQPVADPHHERPRMRSSMPSAA